MYNSVKIRKLMQDIQKKLEIDNTYRVLTQLVISMEEKYNLQEEEIIEQLELLLKSVGGVVDYEVEKINEKEVKNENN